jgi:hypothetical protein
LGKANKERTYSVKKQKPVLKTKLLILLLIAPISLLAQLRNRTGLNIGVPTFPAWNSGHILDGASPPHGESGLHLGLSHLWAINRKRDIILNYGAAYHRLHFHNGREIQGAFNHSFLYANLTWNFHFEILYQGEPQPLVAIVGFGATGRGFSETLSTHTRRGYYTTFVGSELPVSPEIIAGLGYVYKRWANLIHINMTYHINPVKSEYFMLSVDGFPSFSHWNNYQYLLIHVNAYTSFRRKKKEQKWSLCR